MFYLWIYLLTVLMTYSQTNTEEIIINNEGVELPGTLTYTKEKSPLIIWIHGSGTVDRKGGVPEYIEQFRKEIVKQGIAFFSYDKRTVNPKNIVFLKEGVLFSDFVSDAKKVIDYFKKKKQFSEIILIGHSQGSLIAMLASQNIDKYISLAGAGETIDKTLIKQLKKQSLEIAEIAKKHLKELKEKGTIEEVNPNLMMLFAPQNQPFFKEWMTFDPSEEIKKVVVPTLILNGDKDLQVKISDAEILKKAKPTSEISIIKNMNHVVKEIHKNEDNLKSYYSKDFPISQELIKRIVLFINK